jgi:hypothetical protein
LQQTQKSQDSNVSKSWLISSRKFNEDLRKSINTNITSVTKSLVHAEASKNATLHSTSLQAPLKEFVLNYSRQLALLYDREIRHQHSNTITTGLTARTGDVAEDTTRDTANVADSVADPGATEPAISATKRERIFVEATVKNMENHVKRNATFVGKQDAGQVSILLKNVNRHTINFVNTPNIQRTMKSLHSFTKAFLLNLREWKEYLIMIAQGMWNNA